MSLAVIVPTYNERENIPPLLHELLTLPSVAHVIVVDDNSPDGTGQVAQEMAKGEQRIHVVHRPAKSGLGGAYVAGFRTALELDCQSILTMDADFSHQPSYIPAMLELLDGGRDIVIGSRYISGGGTANWGLKRQLLSAGANAIARALLGIKTHDCTAGFRVYRRGVIADMPLEQIRSNGYSFLLEILYRCQKKGYRFGEVPIIFVDRRLGKSKINQGEIFKAIVTVLRLAVSRLIKGNESTS